MSPDERHWRVLCVDDDAEDALLFRKQLEKGLGDALVGFTHVGGYQEALDAVDDGRFDICFVDFHLGPDNGLELIAELDRRGHRLPVVLLTGQGGEDVAVDAMKRGADDYLNKGRLSPDRLASCVRYVTAMAEKERQRREAAEELARSQKLLSSTFSALQDCLVVIDREMHVVMTNKAGEACMVKEPDHEHVKCHECFYDRDTPCITCPAKEAFATGHTHYSETTTADGSVHELTVSPVLDADGRVSMVVEHMRDVTQRRRTEAELAEYRQNLERMVEERTRALKDSLELVEERTQALQDSLAKEQATRDELNAVIRSVTDGLLVTDQESRVQLMNPRAEELLHIAEDTARGVRFFSMVPRVGLSARFRACFSQALAGAEGRFDYRVANGEAEPRDIQVRSSQARGGDGHVMGVVTLLSDVTYERQVDRMKTEFISTAAHELRTPLTSIQGFSELLLDRPELGREERTRYLGHIHHQAVSVSTLVSDLLDLARIESGQAVHPDSRELDLAGLLRAMTEEFASRHPGHDFSLDLDREHAPAWADEGKLRQVLENLLSNAVKYSAGGSTVTLGLARHEGGWELRVDDQGVGMNAEQARRIFERFYRGHAAHGATPGTGLGMTIARRLVRMHGGDIRVDSTPDSGTRVSFTLPDSLPDNRNDAGNGTGAGPAGQAAR